MTRTANMDAHTTKEEELGGDLEMEMREELSIQYSIWLYFCFITKYGFIYFWAELKLVTKAGPDAT